MTSTISAPYATQKALAVEDNAQLRQAELESGFLNLHELKVYKELLDFPELRISDHKIFTSWIQLVENTIRDLGLGDYLVNAGNYRNLDCVIRQGILKALPDETKAQCFGAKSTGQLVSKLKELKIGYMW